MMFQRTVLIMEDDIFCKRILVQRMRDSLENEQKSSINENDSPIFDILNISKRIGLYDICNMMTIGGHYYSKEDCNKIL